MGFFKDLALRKSEQHDISFEEACELVRDEQEWRASLLEDR